jgi:hypothetical protein
MARRLDTCVRRVFAAERDALEALEPSDALFDARAGFVEGAGEEGGLVLFIGSSRL